MSVRQYVTCDGPGCKARSDDYMKDGWIELTGSLMKWDGWKKDGTGICTHTLSADSLIHHFCSWACLEGEAVGKKEIK